MKQIVACAVFAVLTIGTAAAATSVTPSTLSISPRAYIGRDVEVTGTVTNVTVMPSRHRVLSYQLCDTRCIPVVQFGSGTGVQNGAIQTLTGKMRRNVFAGGKRVMNALVIGVPSAP